MAGEAEGQTGTTEGAQGTEGGAPKSGATETPSRESQIAADKAKLFDSGKQADSTPKADGAPAKDAEKAKAEPKDKGKQVSKEEPAPFEFDKEDLEWAQKAGYDPKNPESVAKLVKSYREAQKEVGRKKEADKAKEVLDSARKVEQPEGNKELGPMEQFNKVHEWMENTLMAAHGVSSIAELEQASPQLAKWLQREHDKGWREAFQNQTKWEKEKEKRDAETRDQQRTFAENLRNAKEAMSTNLSAIRKDYADLDKHMKDSGLNTFLDWLSSTHTLPREMVLYNEPMAKFLAKAARAIVRVDNIEKEKEEWQQEYEKKVKHAKKAELPSSEESHAPAGKAALAVAGRRSGASLKE